MQYKVVGCTQGPKESINVYSIINGERKIVGGIQNGSLINATVTQDCQRLEVSSVDGKPFGNNCYVDFNGVQKQQAA